MAARFPRFLVPDLLQARVRFGHGGDLSQV